MSNKKPGPMFTVEDSEDLNLSGNRTSGHEFLVARRSKGIKANRNTAGKAPENKEKTKFKWMQYVVAPIFVAVVVALLLNFFGLKN